MIKSRSAGVTADEPSKVTEPESDLLVDLHERHVEALKTSDSTALALPTGFSRLDALLGGGLSGTVALASPPGAGKTSLALTLAVRWAASNAACVLIASPELKQAALINRLYMCVAAVKASEFCGAGASEEAFKEKLSVLNEWVKKYGNRIVLRGRDNDIAFSGVKARLTALQDTSGFRGVAIADGLQTLARKFRRTGDTEKESIDRTTRKWIDGWGSENIVSMLLSHMPKSSFEKRKQGVFAGTSDIEYRADSTIVLQRHDAGDAPRKGTSLVDLHVTKAWDGAGGSVRLTFNGARGRFESR